MVQMGNLGSVLQRQVNERIYPNYQGSIEEKAQPAMVWDGKLVSLDALPDLRMAATRT